MPAVAIQKNKVENALNAFQQLNEKEIDLFFEKTRKQFLLNPNFDPSLPPLSMEEIIAITKGSVGAETKKK